MPRLMQFNNFYAHTRGQTPCGQLIVGKHNGERFIIATDKVWYPQVRIHYRALMMLSTTHYARFMLTFSYQRARMLYILIHPLNTRSPK